jgi:hypothetical protein
MANPRRHWKKTALLFTRILSRPAIVGFQKIYYGPLLLAADIENSKPLALPANPSIQWDAEKCRAGVNGRKMFLQPINDIVDWNYGSESYCRQILWEKTVP